MTRLQLWLLILTAMITATACAGMLEPDPQRTGVIESATLAPGGNILLRDVQGDRYRSLILALPDELEIRAEGPGGVFEVVSKSALQPGARVQFERTDDLILLITPPGFWAKKIWVLRD